MPIGTVSDKATAAPATLLFIGLEIGRRSLNTLADTHNPWQSLRYVIA
jgi:hypothetical protein